MMMVENLIRNATIRLSIFFSQTLHSAKAFLLVSALFASDKENIKNYDNKNIIMSHWSHADKIDPKIYNTKVLTSE